MYLSRKGGFGQVFHCFFIYCSFDNHNLIFKVCGFLLFILALRILHLVQGTQGVDKLLSPRRRKFSWQDGKRIVHRLVETQLEYEDKVIVSWYMSVKSSEMFLVMGWLHYTSCRITIRQVVVFLGRILARFMRSTS